MSTLGADSFLVLSDFDDTLKISHTTNRMKTVLRGLFAKQAYAGMAELYQEWIGEHGFILLSSSPNAIRGKINRFLDRHNYPPREIWLRDWFKQKDIRQYKYDALIKLEKRDEKHFIFVGDDAEYDPEVFVSFRERNPERTLAIYTRRVRGRPLPEGVIPFSSAFEIAVAELGAGRLSIPQVSRVGKAIIEQLDPDQIIPYFTAVPENLGNLEKFATLTQIVEGVNQCYEKIRKERLPK